VKVENAAKESPATPVSAPKKKTSSGDVKATKRVKSSVGSDEENEAESADGEEDHAGDEGEVSKRTSAVIHVGVEKSFPLVISTCMTSPRRRLLL